MTNTKILKMETKNLVHLITIEVTATVDLFIRTYTMRQMVCQTYCQLNFLLMLPSRNPIIIRKNSERALQQHQHTLLWVFIYAQ